MSFVERSSLSQRVPYRRFHCNTVDVIDSDVCMYGGCSGSDGLVKIWTVRTNECVTTLDQHTEKVHITFNSLLCVCSK